MQVDISRQVSKWKAIDRWENEGGKTCLQSSITPDEVPGGSDTYMVYNAGTTNSVRELDLPRVRPKSQG